MAFEPETRRRRSDDGSQLDDLDGGRRRPGVGVGVTVCNFTFHLTAASLCVRKEMAAATGPMYVRKSTAVRLGLECMHSAGRSWEQAHTPYAELLRRAMQAGPADAVAVDRQQLQVALGSSTFRRTGSRLRPA